MLPPKQFFSQKISIDLSDELFKQILKDIKIHRKDQN